MRNICLIFLIAATPLLVTSQSYLDSLRNIWQDDGQPDTTRLIALERFIISGYFNAKPDSALYFIDRAYDLAREKGQKKYMVDNLNLKGFHFLPRNDSLALEYLAQGLELAKEIDYPEGEANSLKNTGTILKNRGNLLGAIEAYEEGLAIAEKYGLDELRWKFLSNLGVVFRRQSNYPKALEFYQHALVAISELGERGNPQFTALILFNMGGVHSAQKEYQRAIDNYRESLEVAKGAGNTTMVAAILANIGDVYGMLGEHQEALSYLDQALELYRELGAKPAIVTTLQSMAEIHFLRNDFDRSQALAEQGIVLSREIGQKVATSACLTIAGKNNWMKGENVAAIAHCKEGLDLAAEAGTLKEQQEACACLYQVYRGNGRAQEALGFYEQMVALRDSMFNEENTKKLTQLEMQYEFDKKEAATQAEQEKKDAVAAQELRRQKLVRNGFMGGFALVAVFAGIFLTQRNRIGKEKARSEELLLNILPEEVAEELKEKGEADAKLIEQVTVLFTDFKGFTAMSEKLSPKELVKDLHECFSAFDRICEEHGLEKIKTIGDAYMAAGGLPTPNTTHATDVIKVALEMRDFIAEGKARKVAAGLPYFEIRIGVHTGPVVAGIVGVKKFQYDIWGDTVNTASRMESSGEVGQVNISEATYALVKGETGLTFTSRGRVQAKGKGELEMYFVNDRA